MNTGITARNRILSFALALAVLLAMVLVVPGPVEVMAAPSGGVGDANDGVDFTALETGGIYYGTYDHITSMGLYEMSSPPYGYANPTYEGFETPILWESAGDENGNMVLLSKYVLDTQMFHSSTSDTNRHIYDDSDIRGWLNGDFLNTFSGAETRSSNMAQISVDTGMYIWNTGIEQTSPHTTSDSWGPENWPKTTSNQQIYLPWGKHSSGGNVVYVDAGNTTTMELTNKTTTLKNGTSTNVEYWLRSPTSGGSGDALSVGAGGNVDGDDVNSSLGVRPAFQFNPSSIIFTSEIKSAPIEDWETDADGTYYAAGGGRENFKLTVLNTSLTQPILTGYTSGSDTITVSPGGNINLTNTANTQDLVYKIVEDTGSERKIVGYGTGDASTITIKGIANVTSEGNLTPGGDYTLYVWAQKDGGFNSHEGSQPLYFKLNVDDTKPAVTIVTPSGTGVSIGTSSLSIEFSKEMGTGTGSVSLNHNATVDNGVWQSGDRTITYDLHGLDYDTTYTVSISGFQDTSGNIMDLDSSHQFTTEPDNQPTVILELDSLDNDTVEENQNYSKTIGVTYTGSLPLGYSAGPLPTGVGISGNTISGAPTTAGAYPITVTVSEQGGSLTKSESFTLTVNTPSASPTQLTIATPTNLTVTEGEDFSKTFSVTYTGSGTLSYDIDGLPDGVTYSTATGVISGSTDPGTAQNSPYTVTVEVTDNTEYANTSFQLTVLLASTPPPQTGYTITATAGEGGGISPSGPISVNDGGSQTFTITADPDYEIQDVTVDGGSEGAISFYTFQNVTADHTIHAAFARKNTGNGDNGNSGSTTDSARSSRSGSSGSTNTTPPPKTTLPASAFSWDGDRTLTIDHDSISVLGLLSVQWDNVPLTRGEDYAVYQGSVIVRFDRDFIAAQSPGDHTVRVEFLNHTGETTVTVGGEPTLTPEPNDDLFTGDTHNPNTGGYPDGIYPATDNPNTGDGRGIWFALLLGSIGAAALVKLRPRLEVK